MVLFWDILLLFVIFGISGSHSDAAPVGWMTTYTGLYSQSELERILMNATFNSTDNFYIIKNAFQPEPGSHKICILLFLI